MSDIDPFSGFNKNKAAYDNQQPKKTEQTEDKPEARAYNKRVSITEKKPKKIPQIKSFFSRLASYFSFKKKKITKVGNKFLINFLTNKSPEDVDDLKKDRSIIDPKLLKYYDKGIKAKNFTTLKKEMTNFIFYLKDNYLQNENQHVFNTHQKKILYNMFVDMSARVDILRDSNISTAKTKKEKTEAYQNMLNDCAKRKLNIGIKDAAGIGSTFFRVTNINEMTNSKNAEDIKNTCEQFLGLYIKNLNIQMHNDMIKNLQSCKEKLNIEIKKDNQDQNKINELNRTINNINAELDEYSRNIKKVNSEELFSHQEFMDDCYGKMIVNLLTIAQKENIKLELEKIPIKRL